ncbi:Gfo/Idh/MocA family oxidoreductase, partial [bacterium]|nr:Gfo/Idh/MocA family oxidoreductase [bacterium]
MQQLRIGLVGTGNIGPQYVKGCRYFSEVLDLVACSDMNMDKARAFAAEHNLAAMTTSEMFASSEIDIVVNLTVPAVHAEVSLAAIEAGKHVYSEKPLATTRADGEHVVNAARERGVRLGCAPDTFLGGGLQTSLKLINDGAIGEPVAAVAFFANHGPEAWHPNPAFFYQPGAGPMFDMGPYYLT